MTTDKNNAAPDLQRAELAEQQGVSFPPFPRTYYDAFGDRSEPLYTGKQMQDYARAALAATGKQQVGEVQGDSILRAAVAPPRRFDPIAAEAELSKLAARQPVCGTCAEVIQPDGLTGTTCSCARQPQAGKYDQSAEDRFEQFVQAEIARSPDALRELGEYLGRVLDEDEFPQANSLLLQLATEYAAPPAQGIDLGPLRRLYQAYVRLLESGRDRILDFGGTCDPVDVMERTDVHLIEARNLLGIKRDAARGVGNG